MVKEKLKTWNFQKVICGMMNECILGILRLVANFYNLYCIKKPDNLLHLSDFFILGQNIFDFRDKKFYLSDCDFFYYFNNSYLSYFRKYIRLI